jgi:hypothetical protein
MSKRTLLAAVAVAVTGMFGAAPADAQDYPDYRLDIGVNGGFSGYTASLDENHLNDEESARFELGWILGSQVTFWVTPSFGIRANGGYSERNFTMGGFFDAGDPELVKDVNMWTLTGDLMWRPLPDGYMLGSIESTPYLTGGIGAKYFDAAGEFLLFGSEGSDDEVRGVAFTTPANSQYALAEEWQLAGRIGVGTDLRLSEMFGLRFELGDLFYDSPFYDWSAGTQRLTDPDEDVGKVVHELYAQLGAHLLLLPQAPEVVAVAPAPPAPEPEPEPEPEPVEEMIAVCVIDPGSDAGIMEIEAIYLPETRDTVVVRNGARQDFATVVPSVMVANEADWFVRGEPLTVTLGDGATIEYTTWQSARMIDAGQLTYLGTVRGLPVYANTDDVADFSAEWTAARQAATTNDIDDLLADNAELGAELEEVQYLYVPLRPTGCVFQAVRLVEQVRKK